MEAKIKCIVKRPDEKYGHVTNISTTLQNLQKIVEGPIECVPVNGNTVILCNEEGKIKGLEPNFRIGEGMFCDVIVGTAIVIGVMGEEICDLDMSFHVWKRLIDKWGN